MCVKCLSNLSLHVQRFRRHGKQQRLKNLLFLSLSIYRSTEYGISSQVIIKNTRTGLRKSVESCGDMIHQVPRGGKLIFHSQLTNCKFGPSPPNPPPPPLQEPNLPILSKLLLMNRWQSIPQTFEGEYHYKFISSMIPKDCRTDSS